MCTFIQKVGIKLIKSDSKYIHNVTKFVHLKMFYYSIKESWNVKNVSHFKQQLYNNGDNNNKCFLSSKLAF